MRGCSRKLWASFDGHSCHLPGPLRGSVTTSASLIANTPVTFATPLINATAYAISFNITTCPTTHPPLQSRVEMRRRSEIDKIGQKVFSELLCGGSMYDLGTQHHNEK